MAGLLIAAAPLLAQAPPAAPPSSLPSAAQSTSEVAPLPPVSGGSLPEAAARAIGEEFGLNGGEHPIDLPTSLRLADADNVRIQIAREQVSEAWARVDRAEGLWLPSLRMGGSYNRHDGRLQDAAGNVLDISRSAFYAGAGAGAAGTASPLVPGVYANFHLADAIFQPLAARQGACARRFAAAATTNDVLLQVATAYLELVQAAFEVAIAVEARDDAQRLADLTATYANSGQGLQSDAERAAAELALRKNDVLRSGESLQVASARLAELLRLDPTLRLVPLDPVAAPITMVPGEIPLGELVAEALTGRPELWEARYLVGQAVERMRRERYSVLIPSLIVGTSYGAFGGGPNSFVGNTSDRIDFDALAFWELRNLGHGDRAARAEANSQLRQANLQQLRSMDAVVREVVESHARVVARRPAIDVAREGVAAAVASQRRNLERIQAAQGLPIEVLQSNQALAAARRDYLRWTTDYNIAQFNLYRALGWPTKSIGSAGPPEPEPR